MTLELFRFQVEALTRDCKGKCQRDLKTPDGEKSTLKIQKDRYNQIKKRKKKLNYLNNSIILQYPQFFMQFSIRSCESWRGSDVGICCCP